MKRLFILLISIFLSSYQLLATHTQGGSIEYSHLSSNTYEITVKIFTDPTSPAYQRTEIQINYGDNSSLDTISRTNVVNVNPNLVIAAYTATHTYPGTGIYLISVEDQNRSAGIDNITNSASVPLYLEAVLNINPSFNNNSPQTILCPNTAINLGDTLNLNMTAFDIDGDSLQYSLANVKGTGGNIAPAYTIPSGIVIDAKSGTISWSPQTNQGLFALLVEIDEYRNGILIGSIVIDFMVEVLPPSNNSFNSLKLIRPNMIIDSCGIFSIKAKGNETVRIEAIITDSSNTNTNRNFLSLHSYFGSGLLNSIAEDSIIDSSQYTETIQIKLAIDDRDARCAPYSIFIRGTYEQLLYQDLHIFIFVRDSSTLGCDSSCSWVGITENNLADNIKVNVSPNPAQDYCDFNISSSYKYEKFRLNLYNLQGKKVVTQAFNRTDSHRLERNELKSGIYFYRLSSGSEFLKSGKVIFR